ncbi:hypothetical protein PGIGA_G00193130 [Pangasianodon gigas]|uniref:Uncharacterized protein n=1 Tax=Pangasianodon gigas TaxID=30993 RepID=A0ACC5WDD2_PANGG|nr:hypothetical protein [Pangasianodon gigas]
MDFGTVVALGAGAAGAVIAAPFVVSALGFTAGGIAAGSIASWMMSAAAVANGGGVAAGSTVAVLQSIGAAGLTATGQAFVAATGAAVGGVVEYLAHS